MRVRLLSWGLQGASFPLNISISFYIPDGFTSASGNSSGHLPGSPNPLRQRILTSTFISPSPGLPPPSSGATFVHNITNANDGSVIPVRLKSNSQELSSHTHQVYRNQLRRVYFPNVISATGLFKCTNFGECTLLT
ncbi:hypothetical protein BDQ12DRAFT_307672 [Crucibulum laeve]|uniref:Uncharacterized protein n=1 Tax=Crucibulum laeve TaxID=68775 RepID=A0A5C3LSM6_9AGAR|nr:hypothetical protein BDQ12DRAFT_307672 [Crucibulum laeve]